MVDIVAGGVAYYGGRKPITLHTILWNTRLILTNSFLVFVVLRIVRRQRVRATDRYSYVQYIELNSEACVDVCFCQVGPQPVQTQINGCRSWQARRHSHPEQLFVGNWDICERCLRYGTKVLNIQVSQWARQLKWSDYQPRKFHSLALVSRKCSHEFSLRPAQRCWVKIFSPRWLCWPHVQSPRTTGIYLSRDAPSSLSIKLWELLRARSPLPAKRTCQVSFANLNLHR